MYENQITDIGDKFSVFDEDSAKEDVKKILETIPNMDADIFLKELFDSISGTKWQIDELEFICDHFNKNLVVSASIGK